MMRTIILLIAVAFAACNSIHKNGPANATSSASPSRVAPRVEEVRRVTTTELASLIEQGNVVVVDVRNKEAYDRGHIRGAKLLPLNEVGERGKELPRDKQIVTYCG